jgi:predicted nucleotidyltransferase
MVDPLGFSTELRAVFAEQADIVLAYLFGSHARRQASALSDVDIAVLLSGQPEDDYCFASRMRIMGQVMDISSFG